MMQNEIYANCQRILLLCLLWLTLAVPALAQVRNDAQFVSQSVPETLVAGETYSVSVTMKNTGSTTWTAADGYKLGAYSPDGPQDSTMWGMNRVLLSTTVAPGQQHTFTFNISLPTSGRQYFQWRMVREGVEWFGSPTINLIIGAIGRTDLARFVSQSVPETMTAGQTYPVSVTMKNVGNSTWTAAYSYKLGSQNPQDNTTWGMGRVPLSSPVAPEQQHTFTFNVTAPKTAGRYTFEWKMLQEGVTWFGDSTRSVGVAVVEPPPVNDAQFISQSVPAKMTTGRTYAASITMKNTGNTTWTAANNYKLGSQNPTDNTIWGMGRVTYPATVAPGQQATFSFNITAPQTAGSYNFQWKMLREFVEWFGGVTTNVPIAVELPSLVDDAQFVSHSIPSTITAGQTATVSVAMKNTGTTTWTVADGYKLVSQNPQDNTTWGLNRIALASTTAPGKTATFTFTITAPKTAGTYAFQWKMLRESSGGFGALSSNTVVTINAAATTNPGTTNPGTNPTTNPGTTTPAVSISAPAKTATRTSAFEYDPVTGLLIKEIIEPDNPALRLETVYAYDKRGNRTSATVSSPASGAAAIASRTSVTSYDASGQFPTGSANALNQAETRTYDPRFGAITSLTGPNGLTTTWAYDSFGRKIRETRSDGTQTRWQYLYCSGIHGGTAGCPSNVQYLIHVTLHNANGTPNNPWTKTYFDEQHREVRRETVAFDNDAIAIVTTEYDKLGRIARASRPYRSGQSPQWIEYAYDVIGRTVAVTNPDRSTTAFSYNGTATSVTDAQNQTATKLTNSQGQLVKATDAAGNVMTYQYDAFGQLWKTIDPQGNAVLVAYDLRGRKTQMVDPDMGAWTYAYNALGELIQQTDAQSQTTSMSYDKLGRLVKRTEPDLVSTWTYDTCAKGIGKLCQAAADNGYSRTHSYDNLGRPSSTSTVIDATYTASITYDALGRVATRTYPTGLALKNVYNSQGYLSELRNNATGALYWSAGAMDAEGRVTQQTYGNGVLTQHVYESSTGRLKNIYAGAGNGVQSLSYTYDSLGRMTTRSDSNQLLTESFLYDNLNRLTSAIVNASAPGIVTNHYAYTSIGNIASRTDVGVYTYGTSGNRPHAVSSIALYAGGARQYRYDNNGNMTSDTQYDSAGNAIAANSRTAAYTSFNMPKTLSKGSATVSFTYDSEHQRVKETVNGNTTIYLHPDNSGGLFYEKETKADGTIEHRHYLTAGGEVIALIKQTGSTTVVRYMHRDSLGSTTAITDETGKVIERLAYDPYGKRRNPSGVADTGNTLAGMNTARGFTNHEQLDSVGLVHMNGRIYDPTIGRFLSADPFIQSGDSLQSYNRYVYAWNSPLMYTDPSGYLFNGMFRVPFIDNAWRKHIKPAGQQLLSIAAGAACVAFAAPSLSLCMAIAQTAISKGYGASWNQALRAGAIAGATAYAFQWVGTNAPVGTDRFLNTVGHAAVGCASSVASGGDCKSGALSGGLPAAYGNYIGFKGNVLSRTVQSAVIGGTASELGGGKFMNGAVTGAFGYLFNELMHIGANIRVPLVGGAKFAVGVSYENGEWDAGIFIDSDVPTLHAGKMLAKTTIDIGYQTGDFQSNHAQQSLTVQAGAKAIGISVQSDKNGLTGGGISIGPQLGVEVSAQQTRTMSIRHDVAPAVQRAVDRVRNWLGN